MWRFQSAEQALKCIYRQLGLTRDDELAHTLWKRQWVDQQSAKGEPPNVR